MCGVILRKRPCGDGKHKKTLFQLHFKIKKTQLGECQKLMIVKKRGPPATSAPSRSYLRYTE